MSKKPKPRLRGAGALWVAVAVLALAYLAVWSVYKDPQSIPQKAGTIKVSAPTLSSENKDALAEKAKQDAATRSPGAQIEVLEVKPTFVVPGPELRETTGDVGEAGATVTLAVVRDGKVTEHLTYRVLPPDQVVFVEQKPAH